MLKNTFDRASGRFLFEIYTDSRLKHAHHLNSSIKAKTVEGKQTVSVHFLLIPLFIRTLRKRSQRKSKKKSAGMKRVARHRKWNMLLENVFALESISAHPEHVQLNMRIKCKSF